MAEFLSELNKWHHNCPEFYWSAENVNMATSIQLLMGINLLHICKLGSVWISLCFKQLPVSFIKLRCSNMTFWNKKFPSVEPNSMRGKNSLKLRLFYIKLLRFLHYRSIHNAFILLDFRRSSNYQEWALFILLTCEVGRRKSALISSKIRFFGKHRSCNKSATFRVNFWPAFKSCDLSGSDLG